MREIDPVSGWANQVRKHIRGVLFGREIRATEVARRCGWSQSYIAHRLSPRGTYPLSVADIEAIATAIGVAPEDLIPTRQEIAA